MMDRKLIDIQTADATRVDRKQIKSTMATILRVAPERLTDDAVLSELVNDSFALVDMIIELQDELGIFLVQEDLKNAHTVGALLSTLEAHAGRKQPV